MKQTLRILYCVIVPSMAVFMLASYIYLSYTGAYTPTAGKTVIISLLFTMSIATAVVIGYFGREQEKQELLGIKHYLPHTEDYSTHMHHAEWNHERVDKHITYCPIEDDYYYNCSGGLLSGPELLALCDYADGQGFKPLP